ncbi:MAG: MgtC/SapB family protein [Burkholderiales bacterium]
MVSFAWLDQSELALLPEFASALAIGLLMGLERERHPNARAGLRTFAIVALCGAAAATLERSLHTPGLIAIGLAVVGMMMIASYAHPGALAADAEPGTTTIAAAVACYLFAVMALGGWLHLSVMLAILATALLYFKAELGGFARGLERRDLVSMLQFAVVAFVVLPLLPDSDMGPFGAINPRQIWWMVVLISGLSLAGYVALRFAGSGESAALLGILGGLVSSTATTLAYSRYSRSGEVYAALGRTVILTANLVVLARLTVLTAVVAPTVLGEIAPLLGGGFFAGVLVLVFTLRGNNGSVPLELPKITNPAELRTALSFAALYGAILLLGAAVTNEAGSSGIYLVAAASGLADVDAITLSSLRLAGMGTLTTAQTASAIAIAVTANVVFKLGVVRVAGSAALLRQCLPGLAAVPAGIALAAFFTR